jgi:hypothetical protein
MTLDKYLPITADQCSILTQHSMYQLNETQIITSHPTLMMIQRQAFVDILNSADWLLVVLILESDVYLQLRDRLTHRRTQISAVIKVILYSVLLINAIYWGIEGTLLVFWDAFLWLVAFIFIELNVLGFQEDDEGELPTNPPALSAQ